MHKSQEYQSSKLPERLRFPSGFGVFTKKEKPSQGPRLDSIKEASELGLSRIAALSMENEEIDDFSKEQRSKLIQEIAVKHATAFLKEVCKRGLLEDTQKLRDAVSLVMSNLAKTLLEQGGDISDLAKYAFAVHPFLEKHIEEVIYLASHDTLTGALNRFGLDWIKEEKLETPKAVLLVDLTNFKTVNDKYDHQKGDEVLKMACEILIESLRKGDELARIGGDEFVVILCNNSPDSDNKQRRSQLEPQEIVDGAIARIKKITDERLRKDENIELVDKTGLDIAVGGIIWEEGMTYEEMLKAAEKRMEENKKEQHKQKGNRRQTPALA